MKRKDLRDIATYQKMIIICILIYLAAVVVQFFLPQGLRLVLGMGVLVVGVASAVFVFLLATKVYSTALGIVLGILTLVPILGLIVLLIINGKATSTLREHGITVGFLGARMSDID
jgi:hypothetical protein